MIESPAPIAWRRRSRSRLTAFDLRSQVLRHWGCLGESGTLKVTTYSIWHPRFRRILKLALWCRTSQSLHWLPQTPLFPSLGPDTKLLQRHRCEQRTVAQQGGGGGPGARAPPLHVGGPQCRHFHVFFSAEFYKRNVLSYLQNGVAEIRGENWNWERGLRSQGALRRHFNVFAKFFEKKTFYHAFYHKMKWPKSEEEIVIGGLEKLGCPPEGVCSLHCKCLAASLAANNIFVHNFLV